MRAVVLLTLARAGLCLAQEQAAQGTVAGNVIDAITGKGIEGATVFAGGQRHTTDAAGRYRIAGLKPGIVPLLVSHDSYAIPAAGRITITAGHELRFDFRMRPFAVIQGKVVNENNDPVPGVVVRGLARVYQGGRVAYQPDGREGKTDSRGEYRVQTSGRTIFVGAVPARQTSTPALMTVPTYYPDLTSPETAPPVHAQAGRVLDNVDIRLRQVPAACAEGVLDEPGGPAALDFALVRVDGSPENFSKISGKSGADGRFRSCGLYAGEYRLTASGADTLGFGNIVIADRDVSGIQVTARPRITLRGEVEVEGPAPRSVRSPFRLSLIDPTEMKDVDLPGTFSAKVFPGAEYRLSGAFIPPGFYLKDVTYAGASILGLSVTPQNSPEAVLRLLFASDGGRFSAQVNNADGKPVAEVSVTIMPDMALADAELAERLISGTTDRQGRYTSRMLRPGKYWVVASATAVSRDVDRIAWLLSNRSRATEVAIAAATQPVLKLQLLDRN